MAKKERSYRILSDNITRFVVGITICISMLALYIWQPTILQQADRHIYDTFLRANGGGEPSPTPAILDLDEESLKEFGQWPWPRHLIAKLITILTEYGAASIGLDVLLAEPDNSSVINLKKSFARHFNIDIPIQSIPQSLHDNDLILASIIAQTPTVLGVYSNFDGEKIPLPKNLPFTEGIVDRIKANGISPRTNLLKANNLTLPLPELRTLAPLGSLNVAPDADGIIRSIPIVTEIDGRIIISLSLQTLMRGLGATTLMLEGGESGLQNIQVGKYTIPVTPDGRFIIPFRGPRGYYPTFRAADVLNKKVKPEDIAGRTFLLGTSAPGLLDIRATPFDAIYPGVEVHATVIDAILSNRSIQMPAWIPGAQVVATSLVGTVSTIVFSLAPAIIYLPILAVLMLSPIWGSYSVFQNGIYISPLYTILTVAALAICLLAVRFWQEARQKRTLRNAFSRYIAPDMVTRIVERGEAVLTGEERVVSLMFTDIRGFTSISESLNPDQVVETLNRYFTPMTAIIRGSNGTVDKFIGDAIMAFWNAPLDVPHHELNAIKSAMQMQIALDNLNIELQNDFAIQIKMGIGVHTGKVYVGNMGSAELLDYTCIGDTVNLTSRLEGMCPVYGVGVICSLETAKLCQDLSMGKNPLSIEEIPYFITLDAIRVKGKSEAVEICTPIWHEEKLAREEEIKKFTQARTYYQQGKFNKALHAFTQLYNQFSDSTLYKLYTERSQSLSQNPPENWDGVWTFTKK